MTPSAAPEFGRGLTRDLKRWYLTAMRHLWIAGLLFLFTGASAAQSNRTPAHSLRLAAGPSSPRAGRPLLVNGSFEQGPKVGDYLTLKKGSTAMKGWTVTRSTIDIIGSHFASSDGVRHVDLDGSTGYGGNKQTFATTPGQSYSVTFDLAGNREGPPAIKQMAVEVAGQSFAFSHPANLAWTHESLIFTARAAATTIELHSTDTEGHVCGPLVDNVAVSPE